MSTARRDTATSAQRAEWLGALPTAEQTLLLRACLLAGSDGRAAWDAWLGAVEDPVAAFRADSGGYRKLGALLAAALRDQGVVPADAHFRMALRAAVMREEGRTLRYEAVAAGILEALYAYGVDPVVLRGAAVAATAYPRPALRHCHDIDLLVEADELDPAIDALRAAGCTPRPVDNPGDAEAVHNSGLPISLHTRLFPFAPYDAVTASVRARGVRAVVAGVPTRVLAPSDMVLHVCGLGFCSPRRRSILWVPDSWHVLTRYPDMDANGLVDTALEGRLAVPLSVTLGYLRDELGASVPASAFRALDAAAARDEQGRVLARSVLPQPDPRWLRLARRLPAPVRRVGRRVVRREA